MPYLKLSSKNQIVLPKEAREAMKVKGNEDLVNRFYALLTTYPHLTFQSLSMDIADRGARLRAKYGLKTPDAILLATAIHSGATGYLGNDRRLKKVTEMEVLLLCG